MGMMVQEVSLLLDGSGILSCDSWFNSNGKGSIIILEVVSWIQEKRLMILGRWRHGVESIYSSCGVFGWLLCGCGSVFLFLCLFSSWGDW